jgi:hypothetical protein
VPLRRSNASLLRMLNRRPSDDDTHKAACPVSAVSGGDGPHHPAAAFALILTAIPNAAYSQQKNRTETQHSCHHWAMTSDGTIQVVPIVG